MSNINKEEILKGSKWVRFIFMLGYAFVINFALTICIGLAFVQFLFYLLTSKTNQSLSNFNENIIEFFKDTLAFLLFSTEEKPFPFKNNTLSDDLDESGVEESNELADAIEEDKKD